MQDASIAAAPGPGAGAAAAHSVPLAARRQQRIEELCGATVRALAAGPGLHFRARRLYRGEERLPIAAPHVYPVAETDDFGSFRGAADALALRLVHSDLALHARLAPTDLLRRFVFELLEQLRAESQAPAHWPGLRANLRHRFDAWCAAWVATRQLEGTRGLLLFTLVQMVRARLMGEAVHGPTEDLIEATRFDLAPRLAAALAALAANTRDQASYAARALALADTVAVLLRALAGEDDDERAGAGQTDAAPGFALLLEALANDEAAATPVAGRGRSRVLEEAEQGYVVFTRQWDEEVPAARLVRAAELRALREQLDRRVVEAGLNVARLARELQALLAVPVPDGWVGGEELGRIDGRRLAQLVANPAERRLFRDQVRAPRLPCIVTLLLDCSGSMKQHAEGVAVLAEVLARALEQAGAGVEVLGFTTGAWQGGRASRDWKRAGQPRHPGRLAELRHIVFKDLATPYRRARPGFAALLEPGFFREGVDGEALAWACARLRAAEAPSEAAAAGEAGLVPPRRIVVVVSDGSPMETATHLANDAHYLDHHLRQVAEREGARGGVEILGLGVGLDLSPYYDRSQAIVLDALPTRAVLSDVLALLAGRGRR